MCTIIMNDIIYYNYFIFSGKVDLLFTFLLNFLEKLIIVYQHIS